MSNTNDFIIENGSLIKYVGSGGDVVIPEGVTSMSILAFQQIPIVSLTLPDSFENVPSLSFSDEQLKNIFVTEGNKKFKSIDGVLYSADGKVLIQCPKGRTGELQVPFGVKEIKFDAMLGCKVTALYLPETLEEIPVFSPEKLNNIVVDEGNPYFKSVDGILYDYELKTLWCYPAGRDGEFYIPENIECVMLDSFANAKSQNYQLHIGANTSVEVKWSELLTGNDHITIYAPLGSKAERIARRCDCEFEEEGEPVSYDDSSERKNRSFQEWRNIFVFTAKSKGVTITKYVRSSNVVYLPEKMGKSEVVNIDKSAFRLDTTVLCSKKLFAKLSEEVKTSTMHSFLIKPELFTEDERAYLLDYLKKKRKDYLEKYIKEEDYPAIEACFKNFPKIKTMLDECITIAGNCGMQQVNLFLLQMKGKNNER